MLGPSTRALDDAAPAVASGWWTATAGGAREVVPDGAIDVMWASGRMPWLAGADTRPHTVTLPEGTTVVGVRLRAGVAPALLRASAVAATDRRVPLDEVLARPARDALVDAVGAAPDPRAVAQALHTAVRDAVGHEWSADPVLDAAIAACRTGASLDALGLGERQLRRRFTEAMGYGPAFYRRVCRLDRFVRALRDDTSLARLAAAAGYADQSHLHRDCVALLGRTPGELRAAA